jgi:hypothetical protein
MTGRITGDKACPHPTLKTGLRRKGLRVLENLLDIAETKDLPGLRLLMKDKGGRFTHPIVPALRMQRVILDLSLFRHHGFLSDRKRASRPTGRTGKIKTLHSYI